ncbi:hypothetical protein MFLAVUS_001563 [Mucor flavus]|uniref:NADP-dependent oxidoreductase domain-containing protein n=1 Tax=Mucor flavus TaxID=439312 RepID=A0ABP9YMT9_9FUNG
MTNITKVKLDKGTIPTKDTKLVLANGALSVPPLSVGTWQWGDTRVWGWVLEDEKGAKDAFDKAFELGIPFYNTAEVYGDGESEREICRFKQSYTKEQQDQVIVATTYYTHRDRTGFPQVLLSNLRDSLARLGTFNVDLYQIHSPVHIDSIEVVADALADAYDAGLIKTVGVSNYGLEEVKRMHAALERRSISLASNQVSYSLIRNIPEKSGLIQLCHDLGVAILAYSPIGMGLLTGKYNASGPFPERRDKLFSSLETEQLRRLLQVVKTTSEKYNVPQSAIALNWCIVKGTIPLGGARTGIQMEQNVLALGFRLADEDVDALDQFAFLGANSKEWQHG